MVIEKHIRMAHGNGIGVINLETEEDIRKWREERRKNYPTAKKIAEKKSALAVRQARGEAIETKKFDVKEKRKEKINKKKRQATEKSSEVPKKKSNSIGLVEKQTLKASFS